MWWQVRAVLSIAAVMTCLLFAARPTGREIKSWQARRLARGATELIDQGKYKEAAAKARDALQLRRNEPEAWRPIARLLTQSGQSAGSLDWWKRLDELGKLTTQDRRDYAVAALTSGDLAAASAQAELLLAQNEGPAPIDYILAAQVALRRQQGNAALDYSERVLNDPRTKPNELFATAMMVISFTKPDSPPNARAWAEITKLARDTENPMSLDALAFLGQQTTLPSSSAPRETSGLTLPLAPTSANAIRPAELAAALESHPKGRPFHRLLALEVRARDEPARADEYVAQAIERFGQGDNETLAALAAWLQQRKRPETVLQFLPLERALQQRELFLQHLDALSALDRWPEVKALLNSERFPLEEMSKNMYLAAASAKLGEEAATANAWQRALEAGDTPEKLLALGAYAERNGAPEIAESAYVHALNITPGLQAALSGRLRVARATGQTARAQSVAAEMTKLWPDDDALRNEDAYLRLLLGAAGEEAESAERQAQALVIREPANWNARATLALARLRLNRNAAALEAFSGVRATGEEPPGALAVRAAVLAVTGWIDGARNDARNLLGSPLLPEERALIAPLQAAP